MLSGVRAPRVGRTPQDKSEPFGQEALDFVSQKCLQHDVEIEVENVDKVGGFVGSLFVHGENLAVALLAKGLAHIHEYSADESNYVNQLYGAEREAKSEKKGLWADYTEAANDQQQENSSGPNREYIDVIVSDIISGSHFYVQKITDEIPKLEKLYCCLWTSRINLLILKPCSTTLSCILIYSEDVYVGLIRGYKKYYSPEWFFC